ncbi:hypothetical protein, partial [Salmonella enterica]|uniref:hypothetical protein n=1 Tax=Salmonella enterica TaxID=28901 RepID=UPI001BB01005
MAPTKREIPFFLLFSRNFLKPGLPKIKNLFTPIFNSVDLFLAYLLILDTSRSFRIENDSFHWKVFIASLSLGSI